MMQPILDYRAEESLKAVIAALEEKSDDDVFTFASDIFAIDVEDPWVTDEERAEFDRDGAIAMIEGSMLDMFARLGLARFSYVSHEWAQREGLVP